MLARHDPARQATTRDSAACSPGRAPRGRSREQLGGPPPRSWPPPVRGEPWGRPRTNATEGPPQARPAQRLNARMELFVEFQHPMPPSAGTTEISPLSRLVWGQMRRRAAFTSVQAQQLMESVNRVVAESFRSSVRVVDSVERARQRPVSLAERGSDLRKPGRDHCGRVAM
jgi:hypothetical protein